MILSLFFLFFFFFFNDTTTTEIYTLSLHDALPILMGSAMLAFLGVLTSIWAEKFDHAAAVTNFVVAQIGRAHV